MVGATPDSFSLRQYQTGPALDQGSEPSCAAFSSCHMQAFYESMEQRKWLTFDGHALYREVGGTGTAGVSSRDVLQDMQDKGCPVLGAPDRYQLQSYAFVDFGPSFDFAIEVIRAAVSTKHPCVLAMLLPSDFGEKECGKSGCTTTASYHQVLIASFQPGKLGGFNSYGLGFADAGWFNISLDYLARPEQRGYLYAFSSVDRPDDPLPPPPPNPIPAPLIINGFAEKANANVIRITPDSDATGLKGKRVTIQEIVK